MNEIYHNLKFIRGAATLAVCAFLAILLLTGSWIFGLLGAGIVTAIFVAAGNKIGDEGSMAFYRRGGQGMNSYSEELGLAKRGEREEACRLLLEHFTTNQDIEALKACFRIALKAPVLHPFVAQSAQGLIRHPKSSDEARQDYARILAEVAPDMTGATHDVGGPK